MTDDKNQATLSQIATDYFLRRREPDWSAADEAHLKQWLKADPIHTAIYVNVARTWASLVKVPRPQLASDAVIHTQSTGLAQGANVAEQESSLGWDFGSDVPLESRLGGQALGGRVSSFAGWFASLFGRLAPVILLLVVLGGGAGWHWWDATPGYSQAIAHAAPQPRTMDLPDGSQIVLNIGSEIEVRYYPRRREVRLTNGEAFFQVAPDSRRPFTVDTGSSRVTVIGTAFNVRAAQSELQVKVQEGIVRVQPDREDGNRSPVVLKAGQGISIAVDGSQYVAIPTEADIVGDWRQGQLIFRQMQLQTVVEDLQRYTRQPIRLEKDQRLMALPVTGSAITSNPETFLQALPQLLPVRVQQQGEAWVISRR